MTVSFNHLLLLSVLILAFGCQNNNKEHSEETVLSTLTPQKYDGVKTIDVSNSIVKWRGTKLMGTGSHEGTVKFSEGELKFSNNKLIGGTFIVDMTSIYNTDIPLSDPVPRKNITFHLNSDFATDTFPNASFTIKTVEEIDKQSMKISGDMKIRGITNPLSIEAREIIAGKIYEAKVILNRHDWNIGEQGSWLEQKLVDSELTLEIKIVAK